MHHNDRVSSRYDDAPHEHYQQNAACRGEIVHSAALGRNAEEHSTTIHYRGHTNNWLKAACVDRPGRLGWFQEQGNPRRLLFVAPPQPPNQRPWSVRPTILRMSALIEQLA